MKQNTDLLRILVLTDHRAHSVENSVYELCRSLAVQPQVKDLFIASRGNAANAPFFQQQKSERLWARRVNETFAFDPGGKIFLEKTREVSLIDFDWIWLRLPRPIPDSFFPYLLQLMPEQKIFNQPTGILETSNKSFLLQLADWCPEMKLCRSFEDIEAFQKECDIVLKPLENYGGKGVLRIRKGWVSEGRNRIALQEYAPHFEEELKHGGYLGMRYLKNVHQGDKRIVVVNGQIIGATLRIPARGSWLCNAAQGGASHFARPDEREEEMAAAISQMLLPKGIVMFGLDTLLDDDGQRVLSEINTLSIGGIKQMAIHAQLPLVDHSIHQLMDYLQVQKVAA